MRVRLLHNVADGTRGDVITVSAEQGEKLIRTGYGTAVADAPKKAKD